MSTIDTPKIVNWLAAIQQAQLEPPEDALLRAVNRALDTVATARSVAGDLEQRLAGALGEMSGADSDIDSLTVALRTIGSPKAVELLEQMIEARR